MDDRDTDTNSYSVSSDDCSRYSTIKAGMEGLDKATVMKIIVENSKGSKFYENELRKERLLQQQIQQKLRIIDSLTPEQMRSGEIEADKLLGDFSRRRCFSRCIVHVDMDAFYAAVEIRDQPELRNQPVAVGSNTMLSTSNYIARRYGVRAGLAGFLGKKLCPDLKIIPLDFSRYTAASREVRAVLAEYTIGSCETNADSIGQTRLVTMSLDEAYLDLTNHLSERSHWPIEKRTYWPRSAPGAPMLVCRCKNRPRLTKTKSVSVTTASRLSSNQSDSESFCEFDSKSVTHSTSSGLIEAKPTHNITETTAYQDPELSVCDQCGLLCQSGRRVFGTSAWDAVREMRFRVFCATRLTCSAGIGPNTLIAKIASDWCKPCGQYAVELTREAVDNFMRNLSVRKVPGIGHVTERRLLAFGIRVCSDLIEKRGILWHVSSRSAMTYLMRIASGHSEDDWLPGNPPGDSNNNTILNRLTSSTSNSDDDVSHAPMEVDRKSMSVERTFTSTSNLQELMQRCRDLATMLSADLKEEHVKGRHLTLKMKLDTFELRSRSQLLPDYTNQVEIITTFGQELLREEITNAKHTQGPSSSESNNSLTLRLMGLRMANLLPVEMCPHVRQRSLEEALMMTVSSQNDSAKPSNTPTEETINTHQFVGSCERRIGESSKSDSSNSSKTKQTLSESQLLIQGWVRNPSSSKSHEETESISDGSPQLSSAHNKSGGDQNKRWFTCPVCNRVLQMLCENEFNFHLDDCLSRETVLEAVKETFTISPKSSIPKKYSSKRPIHSSPNDTIRVKKIKSAMSSIGPLRGPLDKFVTS